MKNNLLILAIGVFALTACKKPNNDPAPVKVPVTDSVSFNVNKVSGDTIKTYGSTSYGTFSVSFAAFQNKHAITGQNITINLKSLDQPATFKYNNVQVENKNITEGSPFNFDYYPINFKGKQRIVISATAGGKTFTDTTWFYIKTYQPVPYSVNYSSKSFPNQTTTSNANFYFSVNSSDLTNTMKYYFTLGYLVTNASSSGTTLIKDASTNSTLLIGQQYNLSISTYKYLSISLTNVGAGTYKLPIHVYDQNGDFKDDTITYVVQ